MEQLTINEDALTTWIEKKSMRERITRIIEQRYHPIILFDDDPDGIISYILFSRKIPLAIPKIIRGIPVLSQRVLNRIPPDVDLVIILDKPGVDPDMIRLLPKPLIWIDHHPPATMTEDVYINPTYEDGLLTTTSLIVYAMYPDLPAWLALIGAIADHTYPPNLVKQVKQEYPLLFSGWDGSFESLKFDTPLARIIRLMSFSVKGDLRNAYAMLRALKTVKTPQDILVKRSGMLEEVWQKYERLERDYQRLLHDALSHHRRVGDLIIYMYTHEGMSYTVDLANELSSRLGETTIVGRPYQGWVIFSIRSPKKPIVHAVQTAATLTNGTGGGHEYACGARIPEDHAEDFIKILASQLTEESVS